MTRLSVKRTLFAKFWKEHRSRCIKNRNVVQVYNTYLEYLKNYISTTNVLENVKYMDYLKSLHDDDFVIDAQNVNEIAFNSFVMPKFKFVTRIKKNGYNNQIFNRN